VVSTVLSVSLPGESNHLPSASSLVDLTTAEAVVEAAAAGEIALPTAQPADGETVAPPVETTSSEVAPSAAELGQAGEAVSSDPTTTGGSTEVLASPSEANPTETPPGAAPTAGGEAPAGDTSTAVPGATTLPDGVDNSQSAAGGPAAVEVVSVSATGGLEEGGTTRPASEIWIPVAIQQVSLSLLILPTVP
jgi:hypothetical protein